MSHQFKERRRARRENLVTIAALLFPTVADAIPNWNDDSHARQRAIDTAAGMAERLWEALTDEPA